MTWLASLLGRLGLSDIRLERDDLRRVGILLLVCAACAVLVDDYARAPEDTLEVGDIALRTVKAPLEFTYAPHAAHEAARAQAADAAMPVYVHRADLLDERRTRVSLAFTAGRQRLAQFGGSHNGPVRLTTELELLVVQAFLDPLRIQLPEAVVLALMEGGFSPQAEDAALELLDTAMRDRLIVLSRDQLPVDRRPIEIIHLQGDTREESVLTDLAAVLLPGDARQQVGLSMLRTKPAQGELAASQLNAAADLARSLVTANLSFDPLQTAERRTEAESAVPLQLERIKRGQILFRAGAVVTVADLDVYRALQEHASDSDFLLELLAIGMFLFLLLGALYHFASTYLAGFTTRIRDVFAGGLLLVAVAALARVVVGSSESVATFVGYEAEARAVWFLVPVAGAAMLTRLLLGVAWTVAFSVAAAAVCGLAMDLEGLLVVFFLLSSVAAASSVEHTRERIAILKAGAIIGVVNAVAALVIHFVQLFVVEAELSLATTMRPVWTMTFAFMGGILSAFLVLGLVPLFEAMGFVTDYRMMELANLNHPLLRRLMLRAPGSYHHSVVVGTLAEAGCEAIGANALQAKVCAYFHDIGKAEKPAYFAENQRDGNSKHTGLDPYASAHIIISHVVDGGRAAREHALPQPIVDNVYMHHGTGVLQFFHAAARAQAEDPDSVDEAAFRYPGPKPSTREAGVIMLADKVEAATRTLKVPDERNLRSMINRIVNSVIADGQFSECPLTVQEIHTTTDTFVKVLLGIYHQRIEYPQTADLSNAGGVAARSIPTPPPEATITLDLLPRQEREPVEERAEAPAEQVDAARSGVLDYEAIDYLPRGD